MSNINNCGICSPVDDETKLIQDALFDKLLAEKQQLKFGDQAIQQIAEDSQGFCRLLRIIFSKKFSNLKATKGCKHNFLKKQYEIYTRQFSNKLKCNVKLLDFLSNNVSTRIAKYNFHTDVISSQVKTFPRHFNTKTSSMPFKIQKKQEKQFTLKKTQKMEPNIQPVDKEQQPEDHAEEKKKSSQLYTNMQQINPMVTPIIQLPQPFPPIYSPINFSWGINFPSKQFQQDQQKQEQ